MSIIIQNCLHCKKDFNARSQDVNRGFGKFCTSSCSSLYWRAHQTKPAPNVSCARCGVNFYLSPTKKKKSKSGLYFCCRKHKDQAQRIGGIKEIMPSHYDTISVNTYRRIAFTTKAKICERCGFDKEAAIVVHHKDRDRQNNDISNLEVLCANCHAIEHWAEAE